MLPLKIALSDTEIGCLFLSILSLFLAAYLLGTLFNKYHLPRVIGEVLGGILLGPSGLGFIYPSHYEHLFNAFPDQGRILSFLYWFGLILLMLTAGFHLKEKIAARDKKVMVVLFLSSTFLPILGAIIYYALFNFDAYAGPAGTPLSMIVIICLAMSITSIPVISKIFIDLNIINTRFAKIILGVAITHDIILWGILGIVLKIDHNHQFFSIIISIIYTLIFLLAAMIAAYYIGKFAHKINTINFSENFSIFIIISFCLLMVSITNMLKINIIFGALMAGVILSRSQNSNLQKAKETIAAFSLSFFVPLYFAIVGLKINLPEYFNAGFFISFLLISSGVSMISICLSLKAMKESWLTSFNFATATTARGGPGIVLASMAYEANLINGTFFVVLVLSAIITSFFAGSWLRFVLQKKWPLYGNFN